MKKAYLVFVLLINFMSASCQVKDEAFLKFSNNLQSFELPLVTSEMSKEVSFNETAKSLTNAEHAYFKLNGKDWAIGKNYSYEGYGKINLSNNLIGVIYKRSYLPDNILEEKSETVLAIFTDAGELIQSLPIQGYYGDDTSFTSRISLDKEITINYETLTYNKSTDATIPKKYIERYKIKDSGEIQKF